MINKKKLHFYQLAAVFMSISILALTYNWGYSTKNEGETSMMAGSMGKMMSSMHLTNIKLSDLLISESENKGNSNSNDSSMHQQGERTYIKDIFDLCTIIIVILIPFIVAGAIFLAIIWVK